PARKRARGMYGTWEGLGVRPADSLLHAMQPYMAWPDIAAWMADGHQVGLHTRTHPFCSELDEAGLIEEIVEPAARLRTKLGVDTLSFAYPFGRRLPPALEDTAMRRADLSCMLGTNGLSHIGTAPIAIERAQTEFDLGHEFYFRPVTSAIKGALGLARQA
ncbi:polysaccharide deacetylase family protein, partial [Nostoc sp. NIES-2111]